MKLKNKTELRNEIKASMGNTYGLKKVWIDLADGSWVIVDANTRPANESLYIRPTLMDLSANDETDHQHAYRASIDQRISRNFQDIEAGVSRWNSTDEA